MEISVNKLTRKDIKSVRKTVSYGEGRHRLARVVFHGKRGELRQHYREGQEDQFDALGLVLNMIVLWNITYIGFEVAAPGRLPCS